jgi:pimeloyl-ACP methyl ester carboxylesterase
MTVSYAQQEKYAAIEGHRICYVDEGEGPTLLLIHGLGGSIQNWEPVIDFFRHDYRVIALDLPGFGKSEIVDGDYGLDFFARHIRGLLAELGTGSASVAGHSLGGLISLHLVLNHPDMVENLVLVDNAGSHDFSEIMKRALRNLPRGLIKRFLLFFISHLARIRVFRRAAGVQNVNQYTDALIANAVALADRPDIDAYLDAYIDTARTALNVSYNDRLAEISKPTLIVWGQNDLTISLKVGQGENKKIKGSFLVSIPRADHVVQLDQPEMFNAAVARFLAGARGATG